MFSQQQESNGMNGNGGGGPGSARMSSNRYDDDNDDILPDTNIDRERTLTGSAQFNLTKIVAFSHNIIMAF